MKDAIIAISLIIVLCFGVAGAVYMYEDIPVTYDGRGTDVYELQQDPYDYDVADPAPEAAPTNTVTESLATSQAVTPVTAIVFDFRGYDTLGESFVLLIAITGATVILRKHRDRWEGGK